MKKYVEKLLFVLKSRKYLAKLSPFERGVVTSIRAKRLTYLSELKLYSIVDTIKQVKSQNLQGLYIEAGCALGGSTILISKIKKKQSKLQVYDVFGMIPPPTDEDTSDVHERYEVIKSGDSKGISGDKYYGYEDDLYNKVLENLNSFNIDAEEENLHLIKGLVQDTMQISEPVVFAHIDVDWYEPVKTCLDQIYPHLVVGGSIILDDYFDWGGCRKATDEFLERVGNEFKLVSGFQSLKLIRMK